MNRKKLYLLITLVLTIIFTGKSYSIDITRWADQSTYKCQGGIVAVGDLDRTIMEKCGKPLDITSRLADSDEIWIYHFGNSRFMYYFPFLNGRLQRIVGAPCSVDDPKCFDLR
jgi:hypothetical protein